MHVYAFAAAQSSSSSKFCHVVYSCCFGPLLFVSLGAIYIGVLFDLLVASSSASTGGTGGTGGTGETRDGLFSVISLSLL